MVETWSNLENQQYFEIYVIFRFKINSECVTSRLKQGKILNIFTKEVDNVGNTIRGTAQIFANFFNIGCLLEAIVVITSDIFCFPLSIILWNLFKI